MKKITIAFTVIVLIVAGALFAFPAFFKQSLIEATKTTLNKQINAEVEFSDLNLSLFSDFPHVNMVLKEVLIVGKENFQNDTLLIAPIVKAKMSLATLFKKSGKSIEEVIIDNPRLNLLVNEQGDANWELVAGEESALKNSGYKQEDVNENNSFELQLEKIEVKDALFTYNDFPAKTKLEFSNINLDISGKMYGSSTELLTEGKVENTVLNYDGVDYISNTSLEMSTLLDVDYEELKITILENELLVNGLPMALTGKIEVPSDSIFFDLEMATSDSEFEDFLDFIPSTFEKYMDEITCSGSASITGEIKGIYFEENYPSFSLALNVKDGNFQYENLPEQIKDIQADVLIAKSQGELNRTEILIKEAHAQIKNNPVDLMLKLNNLYKDPWFDGAFIGKINFDHLKNVLPLDSVNVSGEVDANLFVKGNYSDVENERYEKIKSDGVVMLDNFLFDSPKFTKQIFVPKGKLYFSPENIDLQEFNVEVGESDFNLSGKVYNYLNYILKEGTIEGNLQLSSNFVNLNEILRLQKTEEIVENKETENAKEGAPGKSGLNSEPEIMALDIPHNINISFSSKIENAIFDRLPISDINGLITARNGKLVLNGLNMKMLDGELNLNGSYENNELNHPLVDLGVEIISFDIPIAYQSLTGIKKMLPIAGNSRGKFSSSIKMKGNLSPDHKLIGSSINGTGQFGTNNLQILNSPMFNQLNGILNQEKLKNVTIDDFKAFLNIENGNLDLKPFTTRVADQQATVYGSLSAENLLDMRIDFIVNRADMGPDIQNILSVIPGNQKIKELPAGVVLSGPVGEAVVKMDLSETRKKVQEATKGELKNSLNKLGEGLKKLFK